MEFVNDSRTKHKATAFTDDWFEFPGAREIVCNILSSRQLFTIIYVEIFPCNISLQNIMMTK